MPISRIHINHFRNISDLEINLHPEVNIFFGENGSGKTSILEAIFYLGYNRSFRTSKYQRIIQDKKEFFRLFAEITEKTDDKKLFHTLGIEKNSNNPASIIRLDTSSIKSIEPIIHILPIQLINGQAYQLLESGPEIRRKWLDWGVFHMEPNFYSAWKFLQRAIKQRNQLLKTQEKNISLFKAWEEKITYYSLLITEWRRKYLDIFIPTFQSILSELLENIPSNIQFQPGFNEARFNDDIEKFWLNQRVQDVRYGYTRSGAHRADIDFLISQVTAKDSLSRGQQKLFVSALKIAQGQLYVKAKKKSLIYLVDDLPSELDNYKKNLLLKELQKTKAQLIITGVDLNDFNKDFISSKRVFHVEQGRIT